MLRTFLRSEIQATDSTLMGCRANRAATTRLRQARLVALSKIKNSSTTLAAWRSTLMVWGPAGYKPKSWQSRACESHVIGCQSEASEVPKAQTTVFQVSPARTCELLVTCAASSKLRNGARVSGLQREMVARTSRRQKINLPSC